MLIRKAKQNRKSFSKLKDEEWRLLLALVAAVNIGRQFMLLLTMFGAFLLYIFGSLAYLIEEKSD